MPTGGLGWTPSEFWEATVSDIDAALDWSKEQARLAEQRQPGASGYRPLNDDEADEIRRINQLIKLEEEQRQRDNA